MAAITERTKLAMEFFQNKGWTKEQAAGIVGNLVQESGPNLKTSATGDAGQAYGIAQWHPDRQADFKAFSGKDIRDSTLNDQLEFVNYELTQGKEKSAGSKIKATTTASAAAEAADKYYERSDGQSRSQRVANANELAGLPPTYQGVPSTTVSPPEVEKIEQSKQPPATTAGVDPGPGGYIDPVVDPNTGQPAVNPNANGDRFAGITDIDTSSPLPNVLHGFASYTYGLSLHLLSAEEYNGLVTGTTLNYSPNRVLVASAGRWQTQTGLNADTTGINVFNRSAYFAEDFYFDNLNMTTVIGTNAMSRNTNAIEFGFTLLEPYGMTLINRLLDQANDPEVNAQNYLDMVYLLQIDFFAITDDGTIIGTIPDTTKRFPIKIIQMDIGVSGTGSKYDIKAVPYNHVAFEQSSVSTPANFEITASTIGEFFQGGKASQVSFTSAMNGWNSDLANNNKIGVPDTYTFNIDPTIAASKFTDASTLTSRDTSMANPTNSGSIRLGNLAGTLAAGATAAASGFNTGTRTFSINAGTSIDRVIDYAMRNSSYIKNQITIPDGMDPQSYLQQQAQNANQPLNWYKTVPTVTLGEFDPVRKVYSKNITYNVQPYVIYNAKSDVAPQGKVKDFVKEYNYIYTGRNDDIIDFELNFNTLYYTAQTAYRAAVERIFKSANQATNTGVNQNSATYQGSEQQPNNVMPMQVKPQVYNTQTRGTGGAIDAKTVAVADLEDSLMTLSAADMLSVNLKILGDPQFIKQDDVFYTPANTTNFVTVDPRLTPNGSLRTDYKEVYVKLMFRTPIDVDESTGLMNFGQKYQTSVFSGIYRVLTVSSDFGKGVFTQTLNLIRLPNQPEYDYVNQPATSYQQRNTDITPSSIAAGIPKPALDVPLTPTATLPESTGQLSAQALLGTGSIPPTLSAQAQDLRSIDQTTTAVPVDTTTVPQATSTISLSDKSESQLVNGILDDTQARLSATSTTEKIALTDSSIAKWQQLEQLYASQGDTGSQQIAQTEIANLQNYKSTIAP